MASDRAIVVGFCGSISAFPAFTAVEIGEHPVACAPKIFTGLASTRPSLISSSNAFLIFVISDPPAMGTHDVVGQSPAQLLGDLVANGLRAFGVIRTQVHIHESPVVLVGDLRAQAVHLVVAAGDAHQLRAIHLGAHNLCRLEIGGNEDPGLESVARGLGRDRVRQVAGRGARHGIESERARLRQRHRHHAILKAQRGQADRVVLQVEILRAQLLGQTRRLQQRRESGGHGGLVILRQRQQSRIAPHAGRALGDLLAGKAWTDGLVIVENFQRRETIVADRAGLVSPALAAFATAQFVVS